MKGAVKKSAYIHLVVKSPGVHLSNNIFSIFTFRDKAAGGKKQHGIMIPEQVTLYSWAKGDLFVPSLSS